MPPNAAWSAAIFSWKNGAAGIAIAMLGMNLSDYPLWSIEKPQCLQDEVKTFVPG
jgi:hypothetical protein